MVDNVESFLEIQAYSSNNYITTIWFRPNTEIIIINPANAETLSGVLFNLIILFKSNHEDP